MKAFTNAPILVISDWAHQFELMFDASDYTLGVVLGQKRDKLFRAFYYTSKMFDVAQWNYTTTKKYMLAVVFAFDVFRSYLIDTKILVYTDHTAIGIYLIKKMQNQDLFVGCYFCRSLIVRSKIENVVRMLWQTIC